LTKKFFSILVESFLKNIKVNLDLNFLKF